MEKGEIENYYRVLTDAWRFIRNSIQTFEDTEAWWKWDAMVAGASEIAKKYGNCRFALDIMTAVANELERIAKDKETKIRSKNGERNAD